jgi:lipoic acid synthetase
LSRVRILGRPSERHALKVRLRQAQLHTVCEEGRCPNIGECFALKTATFLVLGAVCTRSCRFCAVVKDRLPVALDQDEPRRIAEAVRDLGIRHVVITSVTRDDLADGGAAHIAACIRAVRAQSPGSAIEVLVPDFQGDREAVRSVLAEAPEVFNHNVECVPRLYPSVRPQADFERSLTILNEAASTGSCVCKSGLMVGLGESENEVVDVLARLQRVGCQVVTIGQYLRPSQGHVPVARMVEEAEYERYRRVGTELGLLQVIAGTLVRSSYRAAATLDACHGIGNL